MIQIPHCDFLSARFFSIENVLFHELDMNVKLKPNEFVTQLEVKDVKEAIDSAHF